MINKIIDAISISINSCFGDDYEIYTESIEQGLQDPCFSVICLNPTIEQFMGKRYFRQNKFCIHYFPSSPEKRSECYEVMEKLMDALEYITVEGDVTRGSKMSGVVDDNVLHFFVNYDMFVYKKEAPEPVMETVSHNTNVKG